MHQHCINVSFCFVLWSHSSFCFLILVLGLSRPDRSPTTRPNRPTTTRFRPEPKVQSVGGGFPFSKTDTGGSSDGFDLQNPSNPNRLELQKNPTKSCKNKPDPARSRPNLERSRPDPAISSGI